MTKAATVTIDRTSQDQWVPIRDMRVSSKAQATYSEGRATDMAANFDIEAVGRIVVNLRGGFYWIIDGQHRVGALKLIGYEDQKIECEVYEGLTEKQEAYLFIMRNNKRNPSPLDKFLVAITAGMPEEVAIDKIARANGFLITKGPGDYHIQAVGAMRNSYNEAGAAVVSRALSIIGSSWDGHKESLKGAMIQGMAMVLNRYGDQVNDAKAIDKLSRVDPHKIAVRGSMYRTTMGRSIPECVAASITDTINSGTRGPKNLGSWWS